MPFKTSCEDFHHLNEKVNSFHQHPHIQSHMKIVLGGCNGAADDLERRQKQFQHDIQLSISRILNIISGLLGTQLSMVIQAIAFNISLK